MSQMGILDSKGLLKLPENLLHKSAQNRITGVKLGRVLIVAKYIAKTACLSCVDDLVEWAEDQQMVIGGRSRKEFAEVVKANPMVNGGEEKK